MIIACFAAVLGLVQPGTPPSAPDSAPQVPPVTPAAQTAVVPAAKVLPQLIVTLDLDEAPELKEWAEKARAVCIEWFPRLVAELDSEGFKPTTELKIVFKRKYFAPAAASGSTITVNYEHVRKYPDDLGMMVHELTHVVQAYPAQKRGSDLGWLTEGIADYTRFWLYEPGTRQRSIDREKASYRNSYRVSAAFLGWLTETKDPQIVKKLNARMRVGGCDASMFHDLLGQSVDELWKSFVEAGAPASPDAARALKQHPQPATPAAQPAPVSAPASDPDAAKPSMKP